MWMSLKGAQFCLPHQQPSFIRFQKHWLLVLSISRLIYEKTFLRVLISLRVKTWKDWNWRYPQIKMPLQLHILDHQFPSPSSFNCHLISTENSVQNCFEAYLLFPHLPPTSFMTVSWISFNHTFSTFQRNLLSGSLTDSPHCQTQWSTVILVNFWEPFETTDDYLFLEKPSCLPNFLLFLILQQLLLSLIYKALSLLSSMNNGVPQGSISYVFSYQYIPNE